MPILSNRLTSSRLISSRLVGSTIGGGGDVATDYRFLFNALQTDLPSSLSTLSATYTRAGTKYNLQNGLYVSYGANEFGTSYDVSESAYGYLAEPAATNIWTYSNDPSNAAWGKGLVGFSSDSDTPAATGTSVKITPTTGSGRHFISHGTLIASGVASVFSLTMKADGYRYIGIGIQTNTSTLDSWVFDLTDGNIWQNGNITGYSNGKIEAVNNDGWYKISLNVNSTGAAARQPRISILSNAISGTQNNNNSSFSADGTSGILFWNAQAETGSIATSPIITAGSTVTRAADVLSVATTNMTRFVETEYSMIADTRALITTGTYYVPIQLDDGTLDERALIYRQNGNGVSFVVAGGATQANQTVSDSAALRTTLGMSAMTNRILLSNNGTGATADTTATMPSGLTTLRIGNDEALESFHGYIYSSEVKITAIDQTALDSATA
jgi:hypothetical protein